ncbi:MAG: trypsin-like peptidase domain-containing protein [Gammaproteobacteria bacterium]|nr:trypsin-like peptidase domain-containing protein [Gammaproteobacteria bacterium]
MDCRRAVYLLAGALMAQTVAGAENAVLTVPTEVFRAAATDGDTARSAEPRPPLLPSLVHRLPPPTRTELMQLEGADDAVDEEGPRLPVQQLGIGRDVAQLAGGALDAPTLLWQPTADGGQAAALAVASEGAKALRVRLAIEGAPPGLEVRVYDAAGTAATVVAVPAHQLSAAGEGSAELWTPTVPGDATTVELYLPAGTEPGELKVSIPVLSHLDADLTSGITSILVGLCPEHTDVACAADEISDATRRAVARYVYTTASGRTGGCTGTLLNDTDVATRIPYFLTAQHCLDNQHDASSMELYWFYERASCGGPDPERVTRQTGGATVLAGVGYEGPDTGVDHLLLRLNSDPPDGVAMAGWTTASLAAGDTAVGIHHPFGALKKLVRQSVSGFTGRFSSSGSSHIVTHPDVNIQPGSSGSGLWKRIDGADYLVGVASTSSQPYACSDVWNRYGRFDRFYPRVSRWLGPAADVVELC